KPVRRHRRCLLAYNLFIVPQILCFFLLYFYFYFVFFFFFQAEDGIRDLIVTGVQTCALPIFRFQTNMFRPCLFATRGAAGGRWGHGLSVSFRVSETMLSIFTLSVTPACLRLSVRARFTLSARTLSAAVSESDRLVKLRPTRPPASRMSSVTR